MLKRLQEIYRDDLILHGSYARSLLLGTPFRDIDIILYDTSDNVERLLQEAGIEYIRGVNINTPMFMKIKFDVEGTEYDIDCFRFPAYEREEIFQFMRESFPTMMQLFYYHKGQPSMSKRRLEFMMNKPNPDFNYRWVTKGAMASWKVKSGLPVPECSHKDKYLNEGRSEKDRHATMVFQHIIPEHLKHNPYNRCEAQMWDSKYTEVSL